MIATSHENLTDLATFAAEVESQAKRPCWACSIPQAEEINAGRRNGIVVPVILKYLVEKCGHEGITIHRLKTHFQARHHER